MEGTCVPALAYRAELSAVLELGQLWETKMSSVLFEPLASRCYNQQGAESKLTSKSA